MLALPCAWPVFTCHMRPTLTQKSEGSLHCPPGPLSLPLAPIHISPLGSWALSHDNALESLPSVKMAGGIVGPTPGPPSKCLQETVLTQLSFCYKQAGPLSAHFPPSRSLGKHTLSGWRPKWLPHVAWQVHSRTVCSLY